MPKQKQDIRVIKTKYAIVNAMIELLDKQSFQKISINNICEKAQVSRSTFYAHFKDKYDLIHACVNELWKITSHEGTPIYDKEYLIATLEATERYGRVFRHIYSVFNLELRQMFQNKFRDGFLKDLSVQMTNGLILPYSAEILALYHACGTASTIMWWIENNYSIPAAELAEVHFSQLEAMLGNISKSEP